MKTALPYITGTLLGINLTTLSMLYFDMYNIAFKVPMLILAVSSVLLFCLSVQIQYNLHKS